MDIQDVRKTRQYCESAILELIVALGLDET